MILLLQTFEQLGLQALSPRPRQRLGFERRAVISTAETVRDANKRKHVSKKKKKTAVSKRMMWPRVKYSESVVMIEHRGQQQGNSWSYQALPP